MFKSFRGRSQKDLIRWQSDFARVVGQVKDKGREQELIGILENSNTGCRVKRQVKIDGATWPTRQAVGKFLTVLFSPDDIQLIPGSPSRRRKYLDGVLGQLSQRYYISLIYYQNDFEQRNALLDHR